jgi:hypothetical protein
MLLMSTTYNKWVIYSSGQTNPLINMTDTLKTGSFDTISDFATMASKVIATGQNLDEANTKAKIITPLIRTLGWKVYDNSEVLLEYSGDDDFDDRADYALFGPEQIHAVIEAKQIGRKITEDDTQIRRYMRLFGAEWGLLTNGERCLMFKSDGEVSEAHVESVSVENLQTSAQIQNFSRESAYATSVADDRAAGRPSETSVDFQEEAENFVSDKRSARQSSEGNNSFGPLYDSLIDSIAPGVHGHEIEKLAILFSLVGGVRKNIDNQRQIRGAIHILFIADPGIASSDLLECATHLAPHPIHISESSDASNLLTASTDSHISSPNKLSDYSVDTLARASHAIVPQLGDLNAKTFDHMEDAFATEQVGEESESGIVTEETPGVISTSKPRYGRLDQYEPIGEQIEPEAGSISEFDLVFTLVDKPDRVRDQDVAQHIIQTNYLGELLTQREQSPIPDNVEQADELPDGVLPAISAEFLQKYITYAKQSCYPTMTEEAKELIEEYYVDIRSKGADEDAPVPISARKLEAIVRLAEASARVRLSDTVEREDADRSTDIVESCLKDIGVDLETEQFEADTNVVEKGRSKSQRDRVENIKDLVADIEEEYQAGAPVGEVLDRAGEIGMDPGKAEQEIERLRTKGEMYEPMKGHLRTS